MSTATTTPDNAEAEATPKAKASADADKAIGKTKTSTDNGIALGGGIDVGRAMTPTEAQQTDAATPKVRLWSYADLQRLPPVDWLAHNLLPAEGVGAIYGASASGKSFLAIDMALHIAQGRHWFDHPVDKAVPVAYVAREAGAGIRRRLQAWDGAGGLTRSVPGNFRAVTDYPLKLTDPDSVQALGEAIASELGQGALIVIDTLHAATPGMDENSARDMGLAIDGAKALQRQVGGLVLLVHHTGKDQTKGMRGSSSLFAALDVAIEVSRWETDGGNTLRQWRVTKSKEGEDGDARMFALGVAEIGADKHERPITSCFIERDESAAAALARPGRKTGTRNLGEKQAAALRAATLALSGLEGGAGMARDALAEVIAEALKKGGTSTDRARTKARERLRELVERGLLQQVGERIFLPNKGPK